MDCYWNLEKGYWMQRESPLSLESQLLIPTPLPLHNISVFSSPICASFLLLCYIPYLSILVTTQVSSLTGRISSLSACQFSNTHSYLPSRLSRMTPLFQHSLPSTASYHYFVIKPFNSKTNVWLFNRIKK